MLDVVSLWYGLAPAAFADREALVLDELTFLVSLALDRRPVLDPADWERLRAVGF